MFQLTDKASGKKKKVAVPDRQTDRQKDRQTDRPTDLQTDIQTDPNPKAQPEICFKGGAFISP